MLLDENRFEQFAMQAEKKAKETSRTESILEILDVGKALKFSKEESLLFALAMEQEGWIKIYASTPIGADENPKMSITLHGQREIAKLHWPSYKRWIHRNEPTLVVIAVVLSFFSFVVGAICLFR
jgi:hypothetical protein